jgi:hypothetical protein
MKNHTLSTVSSTSTVSSASTSPGAHLRHAVAAPGDARNQTDARISSRTLDDAGMATTEYALVTVAAAGFAGVLLVILNSGEARELLLGIVRSALG